MTKRHPIQGHPSRKDFCIIDDFSVVYLAEHIDWRVYAKNIRYQIRSCRNTAICRYCDVFSEDDPISSYALSCNSREILRKLCHHQKKAYFLSVVEDHFERKSDLYKTYNSTWNFLKHADKDPDSKIEFSEEQLVHSLWAASHDLYQIVDNPARFPAALTYYHWYIQSCPEFAPKNCELPEASALFRRADQDSGGIRYKDDKTKRAYGLDMLNRAASGLRILP